MLIVKNQKPMLIAIVQVKNKETAKGPLDLRIKLEILLCWLANFQIIWRKASVILNVTSNLLYILHWQSTDFICNWSLPKLTGLEY